METITLTTNNNKDGRGRQGDENVRRKKTHHLDNVWDLDVSTAQEVTRSIAVMSVVCDSR